MTIDQERRHTHELVDLLPDDKLGAVRNLLQVMVEPLTRALIDAPLEDEKITDEEERAVAEARKWLDHNRPIPHEEVLAELGLTKADLEQKIAAPG